MVVELARVRAKLTIKHVYVHDILLGVILDGLAPNHTRVGTHTTTLCKLGLPWSWQDGVS